MASSKYLGVSTLALALVLAGGIPLMAKDSHRVNLPYAGVVSGKRLDAGVYTIRWVSHSPKATVTFWKDKNAVATAQGKFVDRGTRYAASSVLYDNGADGSRVVREIRFEGSSEVLVFGEGGA